MDTFIQPVLDLVKWVWDQFGYVRNLDENFEILKTEVHHLDSKKVDINREINRDTVFKRPTSECEDWLKKAENIGIEWNNIEEEFKGNKRCLGGWHPVSRRKLGKHIDTMMHDISTIKEESDFKGGVVVDAPLAIVERTPIQPIDSRTSTDHTVQNILTCLRDDKIGKIGVWGMGGVGKTTVMKFLNSLPEITQMFEIVIWVTVSKDATVRKVQNEIVRRLGMNMADNESDVRLASKIFQKLEPMKYLLLLDDVWSVINLKEVGVPDPNGENCCKIVLTSRFRDVCYKMDTDKEIKVDVLSKEEAWNLFRGKVGEVVDSPSINPSAIDVVKECGGLPLVIIVIGGSLRKESDVRVWRNVREQLRSATFETGDMEELVFKQLKFSYERLGKENVKNCFLYCALYPEDYRIPVAELIEHWRAEGFIDGVSKLTKAYDKGHTILKDLIDASLLERVDESRVKMHDVIRDLALRITSPKNGEGCRFLVRAGVGIEEYPNKTEWEQVHRISLMRSDRLSLPQRPICTSLWTLLLQNSGLLRIPESFFAHMHSLRVLNMSNTRVTMLPSSISYLVNLRGLYITDSDLNTLPSEVGALKRLEVLHLGDYIQYLPVEVRQLTRLKSLQVTFGDADEQEESRRMVSDGMLSSLSLLEDLKLWPASDLVAKQWNVIAGVSLVEEVCSLKQLTSLKFNFPKIECLEHFLKRSCSWKDQHFTTFHLSVGDTISFKRSYWNFYHKHEERRDLIWEEGDDIPSAIKEVLNQACGFCLTGHKTAQKLSDFGIENMNGLHCCEVNNCDAFETIIDGNGLTTNVNVLPNLKLFTLKSLLNLRNLWEGAVNFTALRTLTLENCPKLKYISSRGMIQHIPNLKALNVRSCEEIEEIVNEEDEITVDEDDGRDIVFHPRLERLLLWNLPKLIRICKGVSLRWPSLERIAVIKCPNVKSHAFIVIHGASTLEQINGSREWWEALEWVDDDTKQHFQSLFVQNEDIYEFIS